MTRVVWISSFFVLFTVGTSFAAEAEQEEVDIRDLMTVSQFRASGLSKLTSNELNALNVWLAQQLGGVPADVTRAPVVVAPVPPPPRPATPAASDAGSQNTEIATRPDVEQRRPQSSPVFDDFGKDKMKKKSRDVEKMRARISGEFTGWSGDTKFTLDNGQVWEQAQSGQYFYKLNNPEVVISRSGLLGSYRMQVLETGRIIAVRRVK